MSTTDPVASSTPSLPAAFLEAAEALQLIPIPAVSTVANPWMATYQSPEGNKLIFQVRRLTLPGETPALQLMAGFGSLPAAWLAMTVPQLNYSAVLGKFLVFSEDSRIALGCFLNIPQPEEVHATWYEAALRHFLADVNLVPLLLQKETLLRAEAPPLLN